MDLNRLLIGTISVKSEARKRICMKNGGVTSKNRWFFLSTNLGQFHIIDKKGQSQNAIIPPNQVN
jgi:hypothetical protein